jgi:hypothetical protein
MRSSRTCSEASAKWILKPHTEDVSLGSKLIALTSGPEAKVEDDVDPEGQRSRRGLP